MHYRPEETYRWCYGMRQGTERIQIETNPYKFCAEVTPKGYCQVEAVKSIQDCQLLADLSVSDELIDLCYFKFTNKYLDPQYPEFIGELPYACTSLRTEEAKSYCDKLVEESNVPSSSGIGSK